MKYVCAEKKNVIKNGVNKKNIHITICQHIMKKTKKDNS